MFHSARRSIRHALATPARRCGFVNGATAAVQLAFFTVGAAFLMGPWLVALRWGLGIVTAVARFFLNRYWVFHARHERKRGQALRFGLMSVASVSLGTLVFGLLLAVSAGVVHPLIVQIASMGAVWVLFGYPATRKWVFRKPAIASDPPRSSTFTFAACEPSQPCLEPVAR